MKHNALVYDGPWNLKIKPVDTPSINPTQVLIEIKATGICGTDIGIITGKYKAKSGVILGHESSGVVSKVGADVSNFKVGDRVYIDPTFYCGECFMCRTQRTNHCELKTVTETGVSANGTYTKYYVTTERFLYHLPDSVSFEGATLAEPLSCAMTGTKQLSRLRPDARVAVFGAGAMGLMYCHALHLKGIVGSLIEVSKERRDLAKNAVPDGWQVFSQLEESMVNVYKHEFDIIVDTTGYLLEKSVSHLARGGELLLIGLRDAFYKINPMEMTDKSYKIIGSIDSDYTFNSAVAAINNKQIPVEKIITNCYSIDDYAKAFASLGVNILNNNSAYNASALKVVLYP